MKADCWGRAMTTEELREFSVKNPTFIFNLELAAAFGSKSAKEILDRMGVSPQYVTKYTETVYAS